MAGPEAERMPDADDASTPPVASKSRRNIWPWLLLGVLASFTIGVLGSPWLEGKIRGHLPQPAETTASAGVNSRLDALEGRLRRLEPPPAAAAATPTTDTDLLARLELLESRARSEGEAEAGLLANLQQLSADLQRARTAIDAGDAQVRELFLLSLVRRMMAAGRPLDPVEPLLLDRFRSRDAAAVEALVAWSRAPQTPETLAGRLAGLEGASGEGASAVGTWWQRLKAGLGRLVRVSDASGPGGLSTAERLQAAGMALRQNDSGLAIRLVGELPPSAATRQWVTDARLLAEAESALDRLDAAAMSAAIAAIARTPVAGS